MTLTLDCLQLERFGHTLSFNVARVISTLTSVARLLRALSAAAFPTLLGRLRILGNRVRQVMAPRVLAAEKAAGKNVGEKTEFSFLIRIRKHIVTHLKKIKLEADGNTLNLKFNISFNEEWFRFCFKVFTRAENHIKLWQEKSHVGGFKTEKYFDVF